MHSLIDWGSQEGGGREGGREGGGRDGGGGRGHALSEEGITIDWGSWVVHAYTRKKVEACTDCLSGEVGIV